MGKGNVVMFTFCSFFGEISRKSRIPVTDILGCVEKGIDDRVNAEGFERILEQLKTVCSSSGGVSKG